MTRISIVDDLPFLRSALELVTQTFPEVVVDTNVPSWFDFINEWEQASDCVVLRASLRDHVPIVLKVRALTRLRVHSVVLDDTPTDVMRRRLSEAGATAVLDAQTPLARLTQTCQSVPRLLPPSLGPVSADVALTDREIQVAGLYCSTGAPSTSALGRLLGLSPQTIATYLKTVRSKYRDAGFDVCTRITLRQTLLSEGWLHPQL